MPWLSKKGLSFTFYLYLLLAACHSVYLIIFETAFSLLIWIFQVMSLCVANLNKFYNFKFKKKYEKSLVNNPRSPLLYTQKSYKNNGRWTEQGVGQCTRFRTILRKSFNTSHSKALKIDFITRNSEGNSGYIANILHYTLRK